jgi:hypothetical protein
MTRARRSGFVEIEPSTVETAVAIVASNPTWTIPG